MIAIVSTFVMKAGKEAGALRLVRAVERQARAQPGTLVYFAHRVTRGERRPRPTRTLLFYECYRTARALQAHLNSASWQAVVRRWSDCFEGAPRMGRGITVTGLARLAGFARPRS